MASGTPVVASEIPVIEEVVHDAAYLVAPDDSRKMAGAILALIEQAPLRDTLIARGLARASNFSWRQTARQTAAVYHQVSARAATT